MDELIMSSNLELPGFRFHPTEEELLGFYLTNIVFGKKMHVHNIIGFLNIYQHDPWDLPELAKIGEREWYFFVPRDRKHGSGGRPNRITEHGFWKATGTDRKIFSLSDPKKMIGLKKTLVFYQGRAPRGCKSDWVMNEYRLPHNSSLPKDIVLCKIYRKATSLKVLEQRAAADELMKTTNQESNSVSPLNNHPSSMSMDTVSLNSSQDDVLNHYHHHFSTPQSHLALKMEDEEEQVLALEVDDEKHIDESSEMSRGSSSSSSGLQLPSGVGILEELQVPKFSMDWTQDTFWTQFLRSPWLDNLTPTYAMF